MSTPGGLTHIDERGRARMVDVTSKMPTRRVAVARCRVVTTADAASVLRGGSDGLDTVEAARVAGMQGAKLTSSLIPLCHPIRIDGVTVALTVRPHEVEIDATAEVVERTGVEMEALTACAVAALTVVKALADVDPEASVEELTLWHKSGGRSGVWQRHGPGPDVEHAPPERAAPPVQPAPDDATGLS
jgi:cyclic pyranopterin phosphate synthase